MPYSKIRTALSVATFILVATTSFAQKTPGQTPEQYLRSLFYRVESGDVIDAEAETLAARAGASLEARAWFVSGPESGRGLAKAFAMVEGMKAEAPDDVWTLAARTYFTADMERAIALCERAAGKSSRDDVLWLCTKGLANQIRSKEEGRQDGVLLKAFFERNRARFDSSAEGLVAQANALYKLYGRSERKLYTDEVASLYDRALGMNAANEQALDGKISSLIARQKYKEAVDIYLKAPKVESQAMHAQYWGALTNLDISKEEQAKRIEADARALIEQQEPREKVVAWLVQYLRDRSVPRMEALLELILQRYPNSRAGDMALVAKITKLGLGYNIESAFPEAKKEFAAGLLAFLKRPDRKGQMAEAIAVELLDLLPHYIEIDTEQLFAAATRVGSDNVESLALALADRKAHLPELEKIALFRVESLLREGQENTAVSRCDSPYGVITQRDYWSSLASWQDTLGWIYLQEGRMEDAELKLVTAEKLMTRNVPGREPSLQAGLDTLKHLAYLQIAKGNYTKAEDYLKRAISVEYPYPDEHPAVAAYKDNYVRQHGSSDGLEKYMEAVYEAERSARKKMILRSATVSPTPIPEFKVTTIDGKQISSDELRGKVVVINFWGTWCGPCVAELPDVQKLHDKYKDDSRVVVLTMAVSDSLSRVKTFLADKKYTFPVLMEGDYSERAGLIGFPTTWFLNRELRKVFDKSGGSKRLVEEFSWRIEALLQTGATEAKQ